MSAFTPLICVFSPPPYVHNHKPLFQCDTRLTEHHELLLPVIFWVIVEQPFPACTSVRPQLLVDTSKRQSVHFFCRKCKSLAWALGYWAGLNVCTAWRFNPVCMTWIFNICSVNNPGMHSFALEWEAQQTAGLYCIFCKWFHQHSLLLLGNETELEWTYYEWLNWQMSTVSSLLLTDMYLLNCLWVICYTGRNCRRTRIVSIIWVLVNKSKKLILCSLYKRERETRIS